MPTIPQPLNHANGAFIFNRFIKSTEVCFLSLLFSYFEAKICLTITTFSYYLLVLVDSDSKKLLILLVVLNTD